MPIPRATAAMRPLFHWLPPWLSKVLPKKWKYVGLPSARAEWALAESGKGAPGGKGIPKKGAAARERAEAEAVALELRTACPFSSPSVEAFASTAPPRLLELAAASRGRLRPERLWTTLLCMAFLRQRKFHFLVEVRNRSVCSLLHMFRAVPGLTQH